MNSPSPNRGQPQEKCYHPHAPIRSHANDSEATSSLGNGPTYQQPYSNKPIQEFTHDAGSSTRGHLGQQEESMFGSGGFDTGRYQTMSAPAQTLWAKQTIHPQRPFHSDNSPALHNRYNQGHLEGLNNAFYQDQFLVSSSHLAHLIDQLLITSEYPWLPQQYYPNPAVIRVELFPRFCRRRY